MKRSVGSLPFIIMGIGLVVTFGLMQQWGFWIVLFGSALFVFWDDLMAFLRNHIEVLWVCTKNKGHRKLTG